MARTVLIIGCLLFFISCQDNKKKNQSVEKLTDTNSTTLKNEIEEHTAKKTPYYGLDTIKRVGQKQLKPFLSEYGKEHPATHVTISTQFGDIEIELFKDTPLHRANFLRMVNLGYFNTTYFYRVAEGFVIQGGNSDNDITSRMRKAIGSFLIPKEFKKNHLNNYGTVGMAKYTKQNVSKASSPFEFYIVMSKEGAHHLDYEHTVFGKVIKGMEVAEEIAHVKTGENSEWPVENIEIEAEVLKEE